MRFAQYIRGSCYLALLLVMALACHSCSQGNGYRLANFLFDGVPPPDTAGYNHGDTEVQSALQMLPDTSERKSSRRTPVVHKPYLDKSCGSCHSLQAPGEMKAVEPELCYMCHTDFRKEYKTLHGPVEIGYCSVCHDPHSTFHENLLLLEANQLCAHCHFNQSLITREIHSLPEGQKCSACHNPHGGDDRKFLYRKEGNA